MNNRQHQSPGPIHRQDLEYHSDRRTHEPRVYERARKNDVVYVESNNGGVEKNAFYTRALDVVLTENNALERENEVLRRFLQLKKENCDLRSLDIITGALSMCDEKLNEFIQQMYREKLTTKEVHEDNQPRPFPTPKHTPLSPSYGASFPEVNFSELRTPRDDVPSARAAPDESPPYSNQGASGTSRKIASPSYGQSFPDLDTNDLLNGPSTSGLKPENEQIIKTGYQSLNSRQGYQSHIYGPGCKSRDVGLNDPLAYLDTNPYPIIQGKANIEREDGGNTRYSESVSRKAQPTTPTRVPIYNESAYHSTTSSNRNKSEPKFQNHERSIFTETDRYGEFSNRRTKSAPIKQLSFREPKTPNEDMLKEKTIRNDVQTTFDTPDQTQMRAHLQKAIPRMTSTPKDRSQTSPKQKSAPGVIKQQNKSPFKPIHQPRMRFSLSPPRPQTKTPSPVRRTFETKVTTRQSDQKNKSVVENLGKPKTFGSGLMKTSATPTVNLYDSLEQTEDYQEGNDDAIDLYKRAHLIDRNEPGAFRPVEQHSVKYDSAGIQHNRDEPEKYPDRSAGVPNVNHYTHSSFTRPATGHVESHVASKPIYVSSGQRRLAEYPNIAKVVDARSANIRSQTLPNARGEYHSPSIRQTQPNTKDNYTTLDPAYITTQGTGFGHYAQKTNGTSFRPPNFNDKSSEHINNFDNRRQSPQHVDANFTFQSHFDKHDTRHSNTLEPQRYVTHDKYGTTEQSYRDDNIDNDEEESVWVNITQRGKILNQVYQNGDQSKEGKYDMAERTFSIDNARTDIRGFTDNQEGHYDRQTGTSMRFSEVNRPAVVLEMENGADDPVMAEFLSVGSPIHTSTPKPSERTRQKRFSPAKQTNASPIVNESIGSPGTDNQHPTLVRKLNFEDSRNSVRESPIGGARDKQEFDLSLIEAVTSNEPRAGRTEKVKSALYRAVDTLTGYNPNITADLTKTVIGSRLNRRLAGEIAFQLDRRIMEVVIGLKKDPDGTKTRRPRYYGYSLVNIKHLIKKQALRSSRGNLAVAEETERDLLNRLENVDTTLKPLGFNLAFHAEFTQDMVNKYGLMKEAPDINTIEGFGLSEPVVLRMLLGRILGQGPVLDNMLILLDCLCFLSHSDKTPLFMW